MLIIMIALRVLFCEQTLWNFIPIVRVLYISCIYVSELDDGKHGRGNTFSLIKGKYSFGYLKVAFTLEFGVKKNVVF